jgi:hypothetical protein
MPGRFRGAIARPLPFAGRCSYTRMAMKPAILIVFACFALVPALSGEIQGFPTGMRSSAFYKQVLKDNVNKFIPPGEAQALLLARVEPAFRIATMGARSWGTVVVGIEIGKNGKVLHPVLISGPKPLQKAVMGAVRKYKYNPYLLNGEPMVVATTVSVTTYNY